MADYLLSQHLESPVSKQEVASTVYAGVRRLGLI